MTSTDHQKNLVEESTARYFANRTHSPHGVFSKCSNVGSIDYFVTHETEHQTLTNISVLKDTVVRPHSPVVATIDETIYHTRTLQQAVAPKLPQCDPVHQRVSWEEAQHILQEEIKWTVPPVRYQDSAQDCYVKQLGWHTAGMQMSDIYIYICVVYGQLPTLFKCCQSTLGTRRRWSNTLV